MNFVQPLSVWARQQNQRHEERGDAGLWDATEDTAARLAVTEESGDLGNMRQIFHLTSLREVYRIIISMNSELIPHEDALYDFLGPALQRLPLDWRYRSIRAIWARLEPSFLLYVSRNRDRNRVPIRRPALRPNRLQQQRLDQLPAPDPHLPLGNGFFRQIPDDFLQHLQQGRFGDFVRGHAPQGVRGPIPLPDVPRWNRLDRRPFPPEAQ